MCLVDLEKAFGGVPRKVGMHKKCVLSPLLFAMVVDVATEFAGEGVIGEWLYADDIVLVSETIEGLRNMFFEWKEAIESKGLKVKLGKAKVMVSGGITQDGMSMSKDDLFEVCCLIVISNSAMCAQCGKWIHGRCASLKMVTSKFSKHFICGGCEGNIEEAVELEENFCDEVETVWENTYLGDSVSAVGGFEASVSARTRCGWIELRECGECMYGRRFPLWLMGAIYESYVRPAMLRGSDAWCQK